MVGSYQIIRSWFEMSIPYSPNISFISFLPGLSKFFNVGIIIMIVHFKLHIFKFQLCIMYSELLMPLHNM